jgi:hypothetical protein
MTGYLVAIAWRWVTSAEHFTPALCPMFQYNTDIFDPFTVNHLQQSLIQVLLSMCSLSDSLAEVPLDSLRSVTPAQASFLAESLLGKVEADWIEPQETFIQMFERQAKM